VNGYVPAAGVCVQCPLGSYCQNETLFHCPVLATGTVFKRGAATIAGCSRLCHAGTYADSSSGACEPCPVDHYCESGVGAGMACPEHTTTAFNVPSTGAAGLQSCSCVAGYHRSALLAPCEVCPVEKMCLGGNTQPVPCQNVSEVVCPITQYAIACNGVLDARCVDCVYPPFSTGVVGSATVPVCNWECVSGFTLGTVGCQLCANLTCAAGSEAVPCTISLDGFCRACPALPANAVFIEAGSCAVGCVDGFFYNADVSVCCNNMAYVDPVGLCKCLPGWWGDGEQCVL
jgi:hypothetical protein